MKSILVGVAIAVVFFVVAFLAPVPVRGEMTFDSPIFDSPIDAPHSGTRNLPPVEDGNGGLSGAGLSCDCGAVRLGSAHWVEMAR